MLTPNAEDEGGGPAGVVDMLPKRLDVAGVVEPAVDEGVALAGVPKLKVGAGVELEPASDF